MSDNRPYKGIALKGELLKLAKKTLHNSGNDIEAYLPDEGLVEAVNLAIFLKKPLLIKGEPGCGKTRLARALAWELYGEKYGSEYKDFYFEWHIKSTSKAKEGFYRYDHLTRLRDHNLLDPESQLPPAAYIRLGELGKAFLSELDERPVILIDEIDKADIDFPNDLLRELDRFEFTIEELTKSDFKEPYINSDELTINYLNKAREGKPPIIIITSNDEKELPEAFLRRCVFYYIDFPDQVIDGEDRLKEILESHFPDTHLSDEEISLALKRFRFLRKQLKSSADPIKNVSTSELIDWFNILNEYGEKDSVLSKLEGKLPYSAVLLKGIKAHEDWLMSTEDITHESK